MNIRAVSFFAVSTRWMSIKPDPDRSFDERQLRNLSFLFVINFLNRSLVLEGFEEGVQTGSETDKKKGSGSKLL